MKVNIENGSPSEEQSKYIKEHFGHLKRYTNIIQEVAIHFKQDDGKGVNNIVCEIRSYMTGDDIHTSGQSNYMIGAFKDAFDSFRRAIKKSVERRRESHSNVRDLIEIVYNF